MFSARARARRLRLCLLAVLVLLAASNSANAQPLEEPTHFEEPTRFDAPPSRDAPSARAPEGDRAPSRPRGLVWRWNRFNALDYASTAILGAAYLYVELARAAPDPHWRGGVLFDDGARDVLVAKTREGRDLAGALSDWFALAPQIHLVIDSVGVPLADRWNVDVAWQITAIDLQAQAITGLLTRGGHHLIARERPDVSECRDDGDYDGRCFGGPNASFPSGHTSTAFVAAALGCAHHAHLPLYGEGPGGAVACGVDMALATTSGALRLISDRHYASDVIMGAALGTGVGLAVPFVFHYHEPRSAKRTERAEFRWTVAPLPHPKAPGLSVYGWF